MKMTTVEPRPLTWTDHPACIQVLDEVIDQVDMIGAFRHAAQTLGPDNFDRRGILWLPKPNPKLDAEITAQAGAGNRGFFEDPQNFCRSTIHNTLSQKPFVFKSNPKDPAHGHLTRISTNISDSAAKGTEEPHIDAKPQSGIPYPHHIRALQFNLPPGSTVYDGRLKDDDIYWTGTVLFPKDAAPQEKSEKLGAAWRMNTPRSIFFMNIGGPVECQIAHNATRRPTYTHPTTVITRQLDRYDFSAT